MSSQSDLPGRLTCRVVRLRSFTQSCCTEAPFGQRVPRLIGLSGSPSICTTGGITFFDPSVIVWTITPQHTAQYGQFERVSIVFEVFRVRAWATRGWTSNPSATAPAPAIVEHIKSLRETCILLPQQNPPAPPARRQPPTTPLPRPSHR